MPSDAFLADAITTVHVVIVLFMVVGILIVPVGGLLRWNFVRRPAWRFTHLGIMAYIVFNAIRGELCFLTHWEMDLRESAGQVTWRGVDDERVSFVGRLLREVLYVDADQDLLHVIYVSLGVLVLVSWIFVPPRRRRAEAAAA